MKEKMKKKTELEAEETVDNAKEDELKHRSEKAESFDIIKGDYNRLKSIAERKGVDVGAVLSSIEKEALQNRRSELEASCSDPELIEHILELEARTRLGASSDFDELNSLFPEIRNVKDVPPAVVKASKLRGSTLLDEYLRYRIRCVRDAEKRALEEKQAAAKSTGSQRNSASGEIDPSAAEFIKALWGR